MGLSCCDVLVVLYTPPFSRRRFWGVGVVMLNGMAMGGFSFIWDGHGKNGVGRWDMGICAGYRRRADLS